MNHQLNRRLKAQWNLFKTYFFSKFRIGTPLLIILCWVILYVLSQSGHFGESNLDKRFDKFYLDSSHWLPVAVGIIGSISSFLAFFWAIGIYQNSIQDGKTLAVLLESIKAGEDKLNANTEQIGKLTQRLTDASRKQLEGVENIVAELKTFLQTPEVEKDSSCSFYVLSDTLAIGELHYLFNPKLKDKETFRHNSFTIEHTMRRKVENLVNKNGTVQIATLKYLTSEIKANYKNDADLLDKLDNTRLIKKFILPVLSEIDHQSAVQYESVREVIAAADKNAANLRSFLNEHHRIEEELIDRLYDVAMQPIQYVKHLPYQLFIIVNENKDIYGAFVIHIGTYNMKAVANARALVTYDKTLVNTFIDVYHAFVSEQTRTDAKKNEEIVAMTKATVEQIKTLQQQYQLPQETVCALTEQILKLIRRNQEYQTEILELPAEKWLSDDCQI